MLQIEIIHDIFVLVQGTKKEKKGYRRKIWTPIASARRHDIIPGGGDSKETQTSPKLFPISSSRLGDSNKIISLHVIYYCSSTPMN